jgi:hypothetical protein
VIDSSGNPSLVLRQSSASKKNTFLGLNSGDRNLTGYNNVFIGNENGWKNITGYYNTCVGRGACSQNITGIYNTVFGQSAYLNSQYGSYNTIIGTNAGRSIYSSSDPSLASNNIFIGNSAGYHSSQKIGVVGSIVIGNGVTARSTEDYQMVLGDTNITSTLIRGTNVNISGNVGIGTTAPTAKLQVAGGILPTKVTADPCGTEYPEGTLFYNDTSNYFCYCDGTNDVQMHDPSTACF